MTLQLTRGEEDAVENITKQQIAETDLETVSLNLLVDNLRMSRPPLYDLRHLISLLSLSSREAFLRKLASADLYEKEENKIGSSRLLIALMTILEKPICNLDLTGFTFNGYYMEIFLAAVLNQLSKNSSGSVKTIKMDIDRDEELSSLRWNSLSRLRNLEELHLPNYVLRGLDFESIAANFPSLLLLECNLESTLGVDRMLHCLGSMGNLERFVFNVVPPKNLQVSEQVLCDTYTQACVIHHPTLKVVGYAPEFRHRCVSRVCHALQEGDASRLSGESSLEHLVVQRRMHPRQVQWHSGHVRSLCALQLTSDEDFEPLLHLSDNLLEAVYLQGCNLSVDMMKRVIERFGPNLTTFSCDSPLSFPMDADVFRMFPRLTKLKIDRELSPRLLIGLEELTWVFHGQFMDYFRLVRVLVTAPNLHRLSVYFSGLDQGKLNQVTELLRGRREHVARQLRYLKFGVNEKEANLSVDCYHQALVNFVAVICTKAPHLMEVKMPRKSQNSTFDFINRRIYFN